jgi:alkylation response protein AidB-like acyl-CoA dehydrogenase
MDFRLDESQIELQATVARVCADQFPLDDIARLEVTATDRARWAQLVELGVFGILLDEDAGGSGLGAVEAAIVFEQLGSHLVPGPVVWTLLAANLVDGAVGGEVLVTGIDAAAVVSGSAAVEHAVDADVVLVVDDDGVVAHRTADLDPPVELDPLDPLTPVAQLRRLDTGGTVVGDAAAADALRSLGAVLSAALLAGVASRALEVARAYALEREQFGVPIGSFQAIKHLLADMFVRGGLAQSATYAAGATLDERGPDDEARRAAAGAKLLAAEAAIENASTAIQVLGGMGFTWAMLPNYLLKRAWVLEQSFGTGDELAARLGAMLAGERA